MSFNCDNYHTNTLLGLAASATYSLPHVKITASETSYANTRQKSHAFSLAAVVRWSSVQKSLLYLIEDSYHPHLMKDIHHHPSYEKDHS
jgi:hypothetical protein